jgi:hypothetical protein
MNLLFSLNSKNPHQHGQTKAGPPWSVLKGK